MLAHPASAEGIDAAYQSVEEVAVVAHHNHRALEIEQSLLKHVLGAHVQVVGRLIKNKKIDRLQQQLEHRQSAALAATEHLDLLVAGLAAKHKGTQQFAYLQPYVAGGHAVYGVIDTKALVQQLSLILGIVAYLHIVANLEEAVVGYLVHYAFHQR